MLTASVDRIAKRWITSAGGYNSGRGSGSGSGWRQAEGTTTVGRHAMGMFGTMTSHPPVLAMLHATEAAAPLRDAGFYRI